MGKKIRIIYILGHSRSGSTILGFKLGTLDKFFFAGEIKKYGKRILSRTCTCGLGPSKCSFWSTFLKESKEYFSSANMNDNLFRKAISIFSYLISKPAGKVVEKEERMLQKMMAIINNEIEDCDYIIDTSKSLNRFMVLKEIPNVDIYPIYLERNLRDNLASFVKRKQSLILNLLRLKINDRLIRWYLRNRSIDYLPIRYEDFTEDHHSVIKKIASFIDPDKGLCKFKNELNFHVITGSLNTRNAFRENPQVKISNRNTDQPFNSIQKQILKILRIQ